MALLSSATSFGLAVHATASVDAYTVNVDIDLSA